MHRFIMRFLCYVPVTIAASVVASAGQDMSTYYTVTHPSEFKINWKAFYTKAQAATDETRQALPHDLDIAYGTDAKQKLDVYRPIAKPVGAPVFVFLHGGGFREGDRRQYGYVARPLAAHGIVTVVASYRLTPSFHFPDQPNDVKRVLAWVVHNIGEYGGDPRQVYLAGHSAGAILTATVCVNTDWIASMSLDGGFLKGCIPISGSYDMRTEKGTPGYVADPAFAAQASPIVNVGNKPPPFLLAAGSVETPYIASSKMLADAIKTHGGSASVLVLNSQAHDDTVWSLGNEQSELFQAILKRIRPGERPLAAF